MASVLEKMFGSGGSPMMPQEEAQMRQMAKDNPSEFQDMVPGAKPKAAAKPDSYKAKTTVRPKAQGKQLEDLLKLLMSRGLTREQAMAKAQEMGM